MGDTEQIPVEFHPRSLPPDLVARASAQEIWIMEQTDLQNQKLEFLLRNSAHNRTKIDSFEKRFAGLEERTRVVEQWQDRFNVKWGIVGLVLMLAATELLHQVFTYLAKHAVKILVVGAILFALLLAGCTRNAARRSLVVAREQERSRELIQGAKLANQIGRERLVDVGSNVAPALVAYDLSGNFLGRVQTIMGLPADDQSEVVSSLLSSNRTLRLLSEQSQRVRVAQERGWASERAAYEAQLIAMGQKYEAEHNRSIVRRFWTWLVSSIGVGGIIALCIFCPALIPIFGRLLAWVVSKFPMLAGAVGVVSTKAYDAIVRGVENAKQEWGRSDAEKVLHDNLSASMDQSHKDLVRVRKAAVAT